MAPRIARRLSIVLGAGTVALTSACKDTRLDKLSTGISRDSVLAIINEGTSGDSMARVYRQESYLLPNVKGNVHVANILFYNKKGIKETENPTLAADATVPIVVSDAKVIGWGWTYYDSLAKANNFPQRPRR